MSEEGATEAADWQLQIDLAERRAEKWNKRCDKIEKRYRDEREESQQATSGRRMNLLWSNVETLRPSLYGREPIPIAERRFLDKDVTGRIASQILERAMRNEMAFCGFHDTADQAVKDYCLAARGVAWLRYVPLFGEASSLEPQGDDELPDAGGDGDGDDDTEGSEQTAEDHTRLIGASVEVDFVNRKDFLHAKARTWKENEWVSRRIFMGRHDLVERFGDRGKAVPLESGPDAKDSGTDRTPEVMKKAIVYEIWFKPTRTVYFIAKGYNQLLDKVEDPLNLENFWPCPRPLFGTLTNDTLEPVPDYVEYQDQADEIDDLTTRINVLTRALKLAGVYDAASKELGRLLDEGSENKLIPVASWAAFAQKGGLQGAISFLPIKEVAEVISALTDARNQMKQDLYEVTGLADVIRGQSDPRETAEAVRTKGRFGSLRLQQRQKDVARFCRDIICMMGEIIAEHFPDQVLIDVSGVMYDDGVGPEMPTPPQPPQSALASAPPSQPAPNAPSPGAPPPAAGLGAPPSPPPQPDPQQQYAQAMMQYQKDLQDAQAQKMQAINSAIALLRQDKLRGFRIDIETDSTIVDDANEERSDRVAFLQAVSAYLKEAIPAGQANPQLVPLLGKLMMFGVRGFRVGRDLEGTFDEFLDQAEKSAKAQAANPPAQKPDPEMIKAQAAADKSKAEVQAQQVEAQSEAQNAQLRLQEKQLDFQMKQFQAQAEQEKMQREAEFDAASHQQRMQELSLKRDMVLADHAMKMRMLSAPGSTAQ